MDYRVMTQGSDFYLALGPFLVSRDVRRELGMPISSDKTYRWIVAFDKDNVAGFAALELRGEWAQLRHAYVVSSYRGQGIYSELLKRRLNLAREKGIVTVKVVASPASVEVLRRYGFEKVGSRGKYTRMEVSL
jgi:N-acetylglutamate synthase-like GNAT family acetyltransferase